MMRVIEFDYALAKKVVAEGNGLLMTTYDDVAHITNYDFSCPEYPLSGWVKGPTGEGKHIELRWNKKGICKSDRKFDLHILSKFELYEYNNHLLNFDIETAQLALIAGTGKIVTRDGRDVRITDWNSNRYHQYPLAGEVEDDEGNFVPTVFTGLEATWTESGKYWISGDDSAHDLFIKELC